MAANRRIDDIYGGIELMEEEPEKLEEQAFIRCVLRDVLCAPSSSSWREPIVLTAATALCGCHDDGETSGNSTECG